MKRIFKAKKIWLLPGRRLKSMGFEFFSGYDEKGLTQHERVARENRWKNWNFGRRALSDQKTQAKFVLRDESTFRINLSLYRGPAPIRFSDNDLVRAVLIALCDRQCRIKLKPVFEKSGFDLFEVLHRLTVTVIQDEEIGIWLHFTEGVDSTGLLSVHIDLSFIASVMRYRTIETAHENGMLTENLQDIVDEMYIRYEEDENTGLPNNSRFDERKETLILGNGHWTIGGQRRPVSDLIDQVKFSCPADGFPPTMGRLAKRQFKQKPFGAQKIEASMSRKWIPVVLENLENFTGIAPIRWSDAELRGVIGSLLRRRKRSKKVLTIFTRRDSEVGFLLKIFDHSICGWCTVQIAEDFAVRFWEGTGRSIDMVSTDAIFDAVKKMEKQHKANKGYPHPINPRFADANPTCLMRRGIWYI